VEEDETPEECIIREMKEEMGIDLEGFRLFSVMEFHDRIEYTFLKRANLEIGSISMTEGQGLSWFTEEEIRHTKLAYGFHEILDDYFRKASSPKR
jgi:8-oxo-dGTP diphosphatase